MKSETTTVTNAQTILNIYQYIQLQAIKIIQLISEKDFFFSFSLKKNNENNESKIKAKTTMTTAISY